MSPFPLPNLRNWTCRVFRKPTDVRVQSAAVCYLPVAMRTPLKFGAESVSSVNCLRVAMTVEGKDGRAATGWGETPLSVTWAWPSAEMSYQERYQAMVRVSAICSVRHGANLEVAGHPMEVGHAMVEETLPTLLDEFNADRGASAMPHLAALIACSAFDLALHDAYGVFASGRCV